MILRLGGLWSNILLIGAYLALEWVSEIHEYKGLPVTAWNPGLGLVFAVMMHLPAAGGTILFIGMVLAEILVVHSVLDLSVITVLAAISATSYAGFAVIIRRYVRFDLAIDRLRDVVGLLFVGCVGAVGNATLLTLLLVFTGSMTWTDIGSATVPLFVGDVIGIAVLAPLTLRLVSVDSRRFLSMQSLRVAAGLAVIGLLIAVLLWLILRRGDPVALGYLYVLFLPVVGAALWRGLDGACIILAISQVLLIIMLHHYAYDAAAFVAFQMAMTVLSATGLLSGAVVSERNAAQTVARTTRARLAEREAAAVRADRLGLATGVTSALSHEINQPITAARALARAAQLRVETDGAVDLARLRENLLGVVTQIDLAAEIVRRMRALISRGAPERNTNDVPSIIEDTMALMRPRAIRHRVEIEIACDPDVPPISCDRIQVQQVLMNLIGNAIDAISGVRESSAAAPRGRVMIAVRWTRAIGSVTFSVRDTGPGIAADLAPHVFEPLTTAKPEGLGLGLSICALIVEAHGGRIWLERSHPGATEFRFWLPTTAPEEPDGR